MKTLYKISLLLFLQLAVIQGFTQTWPKYYSQNSRFDYPDDVIETYDKGYMIGGNFQISNGSKQWSWLIKTDINGNIIWDKIINAEEEYVRTGAIEQTADGGILTCGAIFSYSAGMWYPYAMKLNACGEKEWCKIFTGTTSPSTFAKDILELPSGEIVVLVDGWQGWEENRAIHFFRLNSQGEVLWIKAYCKGTDYPQSATPVGNSLLYTNEGNIMITGYVYWENPWGPSGLVFLRSCFIMVDELGNEKWVLPFGLQDTIYGEAFNAIEYKENQYIGVGFSWPDDNLDEGLIIGMDDLGNVPDYRIVNSCEIDSVFKRLLFTDLNLYDSLICFGGFVGPNIQNIPTMETTSDTNLFDNLKFMKVHQNPNFRNNYSLSTTHDDKILSATIFVQPNNYDIALSKLNLNLEYDTAYNGIYTYDSLCSNGPPQSGIIYLAQCDIVVGIDAPTPEQYYESLKTIPIKTYPNPAKEIIKLEFENTGHHEQMILQCYDMLGTLIHSEPIIKGQQGASINIGKWQPGMYVAIITSNGGAAGKSKFVVE